MKTRSGAVSVSPVSPASLSKIYYSPGGYWKGYSAFSKLADAAGVSENEAKEWLKKQALWQIYLPSPRYIPRPHWTVDKPKDSSAVNYGKQSKSKLIKPRTHVILN